jgi:autotransporter adhesin
MTLLEIVESLGLLVLTSKKVGDKQITGGYTSDLLSDVMAHGRVGDLWITLQTHKNVLAVVKIKDLAGIVIVNDRRPDDETIQKADEEGVVVLGTQESAFSITGQLYQLLKKP